MEIRVDTAQNQARIEISGPLDAVSIAANRTVGTDILAQDVTDVRIDIRNVQFIDASGLGFFTFLLKRLEERGGGLRLENVTGQPADFLDTLGLLPVFRVDATQAANEMPAPDAAHSAPHRVAS